MEKNISLLPFEKKQRKVFVKKQAETTEKYGLVPEKRAVEDIISYGVVNIDKPKGPTSHQVSAYVQKILGINKSGHSGTLDPKVTGVLPIALGRATRVVQALLKAGKEYVAIMHIHKETSEDEIIKACNSFVGKIRQMPPIKSSVKRQYRYRKVYYLDIMEIDGKDVLFKVGTEAGTYIRKLIHDIGVKLGTGAHMQELRRTKAGPFNEDSLATLQDLSDAYYFYKEEKNERFLRKIIQPVENAVAHLAKVWVLDTTVDAICHGAALAVPGIAKLNDIEKDETVAIMTLKNELIAIGTATMGYNEIIKNERGIAVKTKKVFMLPGVYPKIMK